MDTNESGDSDREFQTRVNMSENEDRSDKGSVNLTGAINQQNLEISDRENSSVSGAECSIGLDPAKHTDKSCSSFADTTSLLGSNEMDMEVSGERALPSIRKAMLERVSCSDAHFKHQQRNEPDLTRLEKLEIATEILNKTPATFLYRFSKFLTPKDLEYFSSMEEDYEVNFYLKEIRHRHSECHYKKQVKNRRYEAMKQLMMQGEYFSEEEMKWRDPYLYDQMIGQYLTQEDVMQKVDKADLRFSTILLSHLDQLQENDLYARSKDKEEGQEEEEEESDEDEEDGEKMEDEEDEAKENSIPSHQKQELKDEFLQIMQERFLEGKDKDFDYSQVDDSAEYDDLTLIDKDEEEKYFNEEEPDLMAEEMSSVQISCDSERLFTKDSNGRDLQSDPVIGHGQNLPDKVS